MKTDANVQKLIELTLDRNELLDAIQATGQVLNDYHAGRGFNSHAEFLIRLQNKLISHIPAIIEESDPAVATNHEREFVITIEQDELTAFVQKLTQVISDISVDRESHVCIIVLSTLLLLATNQLPDTTTTEK
jgi:hypothetical protein